MLLSIGERLKEERERLGLSQLAFGEIGGVKKLAQLKYEKGERYPDALYLSAMAKIGVDVLYIITGTRSASALPQDEVELIGLYRSAPLVVKSAAIAALSAGSNPSAAKQIVHGKVMGHVIEGGATINAPVNVKHWNDKKK